MSKAISLLGSTGSIGRQTLEVARELSLRVEVLAAGSQVELMERQIREFHPALAVLYDEAAAQELRLRIADLPTRVLSGMQGLLAAATWDGADTVVTAVVGMIGLRPTLAAIEKKKRIALANKETLVCAGDLVMDAARRCEAEILPVDSEHSAIFQSLQGSQGRQELKRLLLTCSGGPFWEKTREELQTVTLSQALQHPNWRMGNKITVDCATLMNKGLELMEAMKLFSVSEDQVEILIHRQSILHSAVEFRDGAVIAQLGTPNMKLPIRYALTYPQRAESPDPPLDLFSCGALSFAPPDMKRFPCLALARQCARIGGTAGAILNAANEEAVALFLKEQISFFQIPQLVEKALDAVAVSSAPALEEILEADRKARAVVHQA